MEPRPRCMLAYDKGIHPPQVSQSSMFSMMLTFTTTNSTNHPSTVVMMAKIILYKSVNMSVSAAKLGILTWESRVIDLLTSFWQRFTEVQFLLLQCWLYLSASVC